MDRKRKIAVATAHRAEGGLLQPVITRLQKRTDIEFELWQPPFFDPDGTCRPILEAQVKARIPDVVLIPADRREMVDLAMYCYYNGLPIFHMWAGIGSTGTWDDVNRRVISTFAYLMLCEDEECRTRLVRWGEESWRCIVTGTTHFDDLVIDETLIPKAPYDLILIKPNPIDPEDERRTWLNAWSLAGDNVVQIGAAEGVVDPRYRRATTYYEDLPRPRFIGLLKNCKRFISNSSSAVYEAPYLKVPVVNPGQRNLQRKTSSVMQSGAADRIVDLLVSYPIDLGKLLKRYD